MSKRYRASVKRAPEPPSAPERAGRIGKGKILLILILATGLAAGIYIAAAKYRFEPIFHLYWIVSTILLCTALFLDKQNEYRYTKERTLDPIRAEGAYYKRKKRVKYVVLALLPFLLTVLVDTVYLLFFVK